MKKSPDTQARQLIAQVVDHMTARVAPEPPLNVEVEVEYRLDIEERESMHAKVFRGYLLPCTQQTALRPICQPRTLGD